MNKKLNKLLSLPSTSSAAAAASSSSSSPSITNPSSSPWPWPYCYQPRTLSFRHDAVFKTLNSVAYLDDTFDTPSTITTNEEEDEDPEAIVESLVSSARVHTRLFFEPGASNSILLDCPRTNNNHRRLSLEIPEQKDPTENETETDTESESESETEAEIEAGSIGTNIPVFKEMKNSVALAMDSRDPYVDFRKSMEEMMEAHHFKNKSSSSGDNNNSTSFEFLEELLCWYLRANEKKNHGYIYGAFVDLFVNFQASSYASTSAPTTCSCSQSPSSPLSFYNSSSSSCSSSLSTPCVSESDSAGGENSEIDKSRPRLSR